jgi:hypothetical protein
MTSHFLFLPRLAALSVAIIVLASSMAAAQTPASSQPATETTQTRLLGLPALASLVPVKALRITQNDGGPTQGPMASPADVKRAVGTQVRITSTNGSEQIGTLVSLSAAEVVLRASNGESVVPLAQVQRVERTSNHVEKFAGIGLLVGLGVGTLAVMSCLEGECPGVLALVIGPEWAAVLAPGLVWG